ncbi:MAG: hypothetical protein E6R06_00300 [Mycobacterium sp.]|nr:MAG: hypothetical protein E6R06_00300 [Mycobacterium sp.]
MAALSPAAKRVRGQVAALSRAVRNGERPKADLDAAKARFQEIRDEDRFQEILAEAPKLTDEQRGRLAELLRPVRAGGVR